MELTFNINNILFIQNEVENLNQFKISTGEIAPLIVEKLEIEKNKIDSIPIAPELNKIESFLNNEKLEAMYNNWKERLEVIKTIQIPKIADMLLEADYSLSQMNYRNTIYKIARLEMEIYKVRTNSDFLLSEIKEITSSEEKNRSVITDLKTKYRELYQKFNLNKNAYDEISSSIDLQFENIAKRFEDFEAIMENSDFDQVSSIINVIDELLRHMENVIEEVPAIVLMCKILIPKKMKEIRHEYEKMLQEGYSLEYLNIEYNIEETTKKISDIYDRCKILNLEDSLLELKIITEYFDSLFNDYDTERKGRELFDEIDAAFRKKLKKEHHIMSEILRQITDIKKAYDLSDQQIEVLYKINTKIEQISSDYDMLIDSSKTTNLSFSKLTSEIENLSTKIKKVEEKIDSILNSISTMRDDEVRARQQLEEIKVILKDSKLKLKEYSLPIIPHNYFIELNEAKEGIREIVVELNKKPISIAVLNTRVDTARDLVLKLNNTTKEMVKTATFAEMAIVYGNRYRNEDNDIEKYLTYSEKLFYKGEYQKSLEISINSLNRIEKGIYDKLINLYAIEK